MNYNRTIVWHKHHLKPKHMGGTNESSNILKSKEGNYKKQKGIQP